MVSRRPADPGFLVRSPQTIAEQRRLDQPNYVLASSHCFGLTLLLRRQFSEGKSVAHAFSLRCNGLPHQIVVSRDSRSPASAWNTPLHSDVVPNIDGARATSHVTSFDITTHRDA
ncbi:hypothetical protein KP509_13G070100 [Ceratopteris richardii]|uniref:Uncharacterized protein n=1 Tax=Ceratopteris richardii TaxID=49495 RepID=A0A8T2TJQ1_CERRI|nr:hypothetical protein KP509_13G070100 [Ceratopteris richardii]